MQESRKVVRNKKEIVSQLWDIRLISSVPFFYVNKKTLALGIS